MTHINAILLLTILLTNTAAIAMGDTPDSENSSAVDEKYEHGKEAHKNHCYKCHSDDIYTREDSFIKSIDALSKQVVRCKDGSNIPWFDEDTETVIHFVNKKFYKF